MNLGGAIQTLRRGALAALLAGCSGGRPPARAARPVRPAASANVQQACRVHAETYCADLLACTSANFFGLVYSSVDECRAETVADCLADAALPGSAWTAPVIDQCMRDRAAQSCEERLVHNAPSCLAHGSLTDGAPCLNGDQCQSSYCRMRDGVACGECAHVPATGATCSHGESCGSELDCAEGTHACMRPGEQGASCDAESAPCALGLVCRGMGAGRRCERAGAEPGVPCRASPTDMARVCRQDLGLVCDERVGRCREFVLAQPGEPCGAVGDILTTCAARSKCEGIGPGQPTGTCGPRPAVGDRCRIDSSFRDCPPRSRCLATGADAGAGADAGVDAGEGQRNEGRCVAEDSIHCP